MCLRKTSIMILAATLIVALGGCASMLGLGGINETFYDETTTTTEYETDEVTGERVIASVTVDTQQVRGTTSAPPFGKVDGEVGTTIVVDGQTGGYTFDSAGKASMHSELREAFSAAFGAIRDIGVADVNQADSESEALMREVRQLLSDQKAAKETDEE